MDRPWWWRRLTHLRPVERMLALEISEARDCAFERMVASRHKEVRRLEDVIAVLRLRNAELTCANNDLRAQVAHANARFWQEILVPENVPARPRKRPSSSDDECDLFACLDCGSFLLHTPSAGKPTLQRVGGRECGTCADLPWLRPPKRPGVEPPVMVAVEVDLTVPGTRQARGEIAAELVASLLRNSPVDVVADMCAKSAAAWTTDMMEKDKPTKSSALDAIATGLEKVSETFKSGIVWVATALGAPSFLAHVLGFVVSGLIGDPLHVKDVARAIRVVDTVWCAMDGDLGECASFRHLVITDVGEPELAEHLKDALGNAIAQHKVNIAGPLEERDLVTELGRDLKLDPPKPAWPTTPTSKPPIWEPDPPTRDINPPGRMLGPGIDRGDPFGL